MDAAIAPMVTKTPHYQSNAAFKKGASDLFIEVMDLGYLSP